MNVLQRNLLTIISECLLHFRIHLFIAFGTIKKMKIPVSQTSNSYLLFQFSLVPDSEPLT